MPILQADRGPASIDRMGCRGGLQGGKGVKVVDLKTKKDSLSVSPGLTHRLSGAGGEVGP